VANPIDLICVPQLTSAKGRLAAQNGGYRVSSSACANYGALRENDSPLYWIAG
jgi:hypothetical protein